jgi:hypothetical protein
MSAIDRRIAELMGQRRELEHRVRDHESTLSKDDRAETNAMISELFDAEVGARRDRYILNEYQRANSEPVYASKEEGILLSPGLVKLIRRREP